MTDAARPERTLLIEAMLLMVAADGRIHDDEITQLGTAIAEHRIFEGFGFDNIIESLKDVFDKLANQGFDARLTALSKGLKSYHSRLLAFTVATRISFADGDLDNAELSLLRTFQQVFNLREVHVQKVVEVVSLGDMSGLDDILEDLWESYREDELDIEAGLIEVMLLMAASDGEVQPEEATQLALTIANDDRFKAMGEDDISDAVRGALARIHSDGITARLAELKKVLTDKEDRLTGLRFAYQILAADGVLAPGERECLREMRMAFELEDHQL